MQFATEVAQEGEDRGFLFDEFWINASVIARHGWALDRKGIRLGLDFLSQSCAYAKRVTVRMPQVKLAHVPRLVVGGIVTVNSFCTASL